MSDISIFTDKSQVPDIKLVSVAIGDKIKLWEHLHSFILLQYPKAVGEWNYPG